MRKPIFQVPGGAMIRLALAPGAKATASRGISTQITQNSTDDIRPVISGSNVAWYARDGNMDNDCEV